VGKYGVDRGRPQMTIWRIRFACCITKATNTNTVYVTLTAFQLQQRLNERALMLSYTSIDCLVRVFASQDGVRQDALYTGR
jgi:hypothetical protein